MERLIQQNKEENKIKYIITIFISVLTLRKVKYVEDYRNELKVRIQHEQPDDLHKL